MSSGVSHPSAGVSKKAKRQESGSGLVGFRLVDAWPALPYMAYGVYRAYMLLCSGGLIWLSDVEANGSHLAHFYVVSAITQACVCLLAYFYPRYAKRVLSSSCALAISVALTSIGSLLTILLGPCYFGNLSCSSLFLTLSFALIGYGTAVTLLKVFEQYVALPPKQMIIYLLYSQLVVFCVYAVYAMLPSWTPVAEGPSFFGIILFVGLPFVWLLLFQLPKRPRDAAMDSTSGSKTFSPYQATGSRLPKGFWRLLIMVFAAAGIVTMIHASAIETRDFFATSEESNILVIFDALFSLGLIVFLRFEDIGHFDFGRIMILAIIGVVVCLLVPIAFGVSATVFWAIAYFTTIVIDWILICLAGLIVWQKHIEYLRPFALLRSLYVFGVAVGWYMGSFHLDSLFETFGISLYVVLALILLTMELVIFNEKALSNLFAARQEGELSLSQLLQFENRDLQASGKMADAIDDFGQAVTELSAQFMLTKRESTIFRQLALGRNAQWIADKLSLSKNTVRTHIHNIYGKTGVNSQQSLIDLVDAHAYRK